MKKIKIIFAVIISLSFVFNSLTAVAAKDEKKGPPDETPSGTKPAEPAKPGEPGGGAEPAKPSEPGKPDKQEKPAKPEKPDTDKGKPHLEEITPTEETKPTQPGTQVEPPKIPETSKEQIPSEGVKPEEQSKITEKAGEKEEGMGTDWGGVFGAISVDGKTYFMTSLLLELTYEKLGVGFDIRLLWNDDGIRDNEWKDGKTIFTNTFHHIRYGKKGEDLYAKLGVLDSVTLGHGFIMRRYSNLEPTAFARKWGTEFDFFLSDINFGVETITNDVAWTRIIGGRSYYKLLSSPFPVFIGATAVWDREPAKDKLMRLANGDIVNVSSVEETSIYGCDIGIQLLQSDTVRLLLYGDIAQIKSHGWGFAAPGIKGKISIFDYLAEYREFTSDFIPGLFNALYEQSRPIDWGLYPKDKGKKQGYYGELGARFVSWLYILGTYEKYYSSISGWSYPYVRLEGVCTAKFIPVFSEVGIGFEQQLDKDHNYLTLKSPFSIAFLRLVLDLSGGAGLNFTIRQTYDPIYDKYKKTSSMGIQIKF
ncbi:MAG: hypothetical protein AABY84_04475 [Candidatus Firestonebacteria bacterium]